MSIEVTMSTPRPTRRGRPPGRAKPRTSLTAAQARALRAMRATPGGILQGISWTTVRALRALGLCELGPGRRGRLTAEGVEALRALEAGEGAGGGAAGPGEKGEPAPG